jgi:6-phosphogluconolactonase (cycloisomerase 2 family)
MKNLKFALFSALALIAFTASLRAEFLYVSSRINGLLSFSIDPQTGALTPLPGSPLLTPANIGPITLDRTGKLLYAATGSAIYGYRIPSNGQLIPLPGSPYKATVAGGLQYGAATIVVDPFNRFLFAPTNSNSIAVFRINANGSLTAVFGSPFPSPGAGSLAVDPFGRFLYVLGGLAPDGHPTAIVSVYNVVAGGQLLPVSATPTYTGHEYGQSIKAESTGRFIYVADDLESSINVYQVSPNGSLTLVPGSGATVGGPWCEALGYNPVGGYLYFTLDEAGLIDYHINPVTGLPEPLTGYSVGGYSPFFENRPVGVCVSPSGKFVYVGNANVDVDPSPMSLRGFKVGPTGLLTAVPGSPYYPLGDGAGGEIGMHPIDPIIEKTLGWPSSMVVAP